MTVTTRTRGLVIPKGISPDEIRVLKELAQELVLGDMIPKSYFPKGGYQKIKVAGGSGATESKWVEPDSEVAMRKAAANTFTAMLYGRELGLQPMQSINAIAVVNGVPALWGDTVPGLVMASGLLESRKEFFEGQLLPIAKDANIELREHFPDDYKAVCILKRKDQTEIRVEYSVADAKQAGLWYKGVKAFTPNKDDKNNDKNNQSKQSDDRQKSAWITNPKRMLQIRARTFAYRDTFADVLRGLYVVEELVDIDTNGEIIEHETEGQEVFENETPLAALTKTTNPMEVQKQIENKPAVAVQQVQQEEPVKRGRKPKVDTTPPFDNAEAAAKQIGSTAQEVTDNVTDFQRMVRTGQEAQAEPLKGSNAEQAQEMQAKFNEPYVNSKNEGDFAGQIKELFEDTPKEEEDTLSGLFGGM